MTPWQASIAPRCLSHQISWSPVGAEAFGNEDWRAGRPVRADLVGANPEAPVDVLGDGEKNPVIPLPCDVAPLHVIDGAA